MTAISIDVDATDITVACPYVHDVSKSRYERRCPGGWDFPCDGSRWGKLNLGEYLTWLFRQVTEIKDES
jgi:hypothetical protein